MALDLKIGLDSCDCNSLSFNELTGIYSTSNPTGWGTPNYNISEVISASINIITPSGANFVFNIFPNNFPTNDPTLTYNIPYTSLMLASGLVDGIYTVTYTVTISSGSIIVETVTNQFLITCNLECCVYSMLLDIDDFKCDCNKDKKDNYFTALALLNSIEQSKFCGDITTANNNLIIANKLCKNLNCLTCKDNHR